MAELAAAIRDLQQELRKNTDLTNFVTQSALREADAVIEQAESIKVSERDFLRILELLENPPAPNEKLRAAARSLPKSK
ncbi:DUF1778 domain-containing protein [Neorhizobium sp. T7_12]|uniref:type II toxin-antitoxin system TacA family antitoxin n=1 Tax=Neorhizobium sp. T7_12 TaxID=2093832 RepID=UPI001FDFD980|nr:DUF1778 domain-containing protein [Neorhizobium sp. T7_12]